MQKYENNEIERTLSEIEKEWNDNPDGVHKYLQKGELLVTQYKGKRYIISVDYYDGLQKLIKVNFIYSLKFDEFTKRTGWESLEYLAGYPTNSELAKLRKNIDYIQYESNESKE